MKTPPAALYSPATVERLALAQISLRRSSARLAAVVAKSEAGRYSFVAADRGAK